MKLIVGLGNPGEQYTKNRHNVGYMVIDAIAQTQNSKLKSMVFVRTNVFMNESGRAVKKLMSNVKCQMSSLYVVHDDLDIPLGKYQIVLGKGPKVHNGVNSIEEALRTSEFWRIRVGVDNRDPESRTPGERYVLEDFTLDEMEIVNKVISEIASSLRSSQ